MATMNGAQLNEYLDLIEKERESRPAEAALADEIERLRNVIETTHLRAMVLRTSPVLHIHNLPVVTELVDRLRKEIEGWRS